MRSNHNPASFPIASVHTALAQPRRGILAFSAF